MRHTGRDPRAFRGRRARLYLAGGLLALAVLVLVGATAPGSSTAIVELATLLSLTFLLATLGLWLGMGGRAFPVAGAIVMVLYALSQAGRLVFDVSHLFLATVV